MASMAKNPRNTLGNEVYFELTQVGASVKVVAIDGGSGIEVSVVGPANAARSDLERLALAKLKARLAREP
jgi:hypothetical protein